MRTLNVLGVLFAVVLVLALAGAGGGIFVFSHYGRDLPQYDQLKDYEPPTVTRVHAGDGRLLAEYARQKRVFVPVEAMSKRLINAFLAAEDKNFYSHFGVDPMGILRAGITNLRRLGDVDRRPVGGSTITQQVAKNFLLSNEVSIERKIKEAILAIRIERALDDKDRILELYLNEIYLGYGSYGVAAAALNYFNASLDELDLAEIAYLAALPKAPSNYDPVHNADAAKVRRDWVIARMLEEGFVSAEDAALAQAQALEVRPRGEADFVNVSVPLMPETRGLVSAERLALMKPTAFLVNTARGPVVDQAALTDALRERRIAGAGIDVFEKEPPDPDDPLLALDNVILTPHALCETDQMFHMISAIDCEAVRAVKAGQAPANLVNPTVLESEAFRAKLARLGDQFAGSAAR